MGTYKKTNSGVDNLTYGVGNPAADKTDVEGKLWFETMEKKDAYLASSSSSLSFVSSNASRQMWLAILGTFFVTAIVTVAITYPVTKNAFATSCQATPSTCATELPTTKMATSDPTTTTTKSGSSVMSTTATTTTPAAVGSQRNTVADTAYGPVEGHVVDMGTGNPLDNILSFKGIPYAKPPGRWEMPTDPDPWTSTLVADTFGNTCPHGNGNNNESCLFLNIYAPMDASRIYPVMLWIHGGAYQSGASNGFPGHMLAARGVIVVTINYRLGILGFASGANGTLAGNYGLWDQRQAMVFVNKTISAFGGDPNHVTIFGESAGASSVGLHLVSQSSQGLFQRAILESGNEMTMWAMNTPIDEPDTYITQVSSELGCLNETTTDMEMVDCLKMVDADTISKAPFKCPFCLGFAPVVDHDFITDLPSNLLKDGDFIDVDIMIGTNMNECNYFLLGVNPLFAFMGASRRQFESSIVDIIDYFYYVVTSSTGNETEVDELYEAMDFMYTPWPDVYNETLLRDQMGQACTDFAFAAPTNQVARLHSNKVKVHLYVYDVKESGLQPLPDWIGIYHGYELPYVFGYPQISNGTQSLQDDVDISNKKRRCWTSEDVAWSEYIITLWTNYAIFGEPTPEPVSPPNMAADSWQTFNNSTYTYFYINNQVVENMQNYRIQQTAFAYEYLWEIARGEHFDDIHGLPEEDVVLNEERFEHWSISSLSLLSVLEKRIAYLNQSRDETLVPLDSIFGNGTIRNRRGVDGIVQADGLKPTKPPKTLPNPLGKDILQGFYDDLTYAKYQALKAALIPIKQKYADQILTVKEFLQSLKTDYPNVLNLLLEFLQQIDYQNLLSVGQEAAQFCDVNVVDFIKNKYPAAIALLESFGVLPLGTLN